MNEVGKNRTRSAWVRNTGIALILLSGVFFFSMLSVPWWPIATAHKAIVGGFLFAGVQIAWWVGAALTGPALIQSVRSRFPRKK